MPVVFISYPKENRSKIDRLCDHFKRNYIDYWIDYKDLKPGLPYKDDIAQTIRNVDFFIACFSKEYGEKKHRFMTEELTQAIEILRQQDVFTPWFISVLFSGEVPPITISAGRTIQELHYVDLRGDWSGEIHKLIGVVRSCNNKSEDIQQLDDAEEARTNAHLPWKSICIESPPWSKTPPSEAPPWRQ